VDWCDAYAFCQWSGKRLCGKIGGGPNNVGDYADPTLDQWYHACVSSPASYFYPYSDTFGPTTCNGDAYDGIASSPTQCKGAAIVVKSDTGCHSPNSPYSQIYDMSGNEDEWEDSCVQASTGTGQDDVCRTRGGSYCDSQTWLNCSANWGYDLTHGWTRNRQILNVGFRCCAP
jgi:formylglycine-generating enzyme required for sulfatase activity